MSDENQFPNQNAPRNRETGHHPIFRRFRCYFGSFFSSGDISGSRSSRSHARAKFNNLSCVSTITLNFARLHHDIVRYYYKQQKPYIYIFPSALQVYHQRRRRLIYNGGVSCALHSTTSFTFRTGKFDESLARFFAQKRGDLWGHIAHPRVLSGESRKLGLVYYNTFLLPPSLFARTLQFSTCRPNCRFVV